MGYGFGGYYYDPTYVLVLIGAVICMLASARVKGTFRKYSKRASSSGMTGQMAAERVLHLAGITNVRVQHVAGDLTDHYDPRTRTVNLSDPVYGSTSVAAIAVAAHECGHAIQHNKGYVPLSLRSTLVPIANFGANLAWPLIILGLFITSQTGIVLIELGIVAFSASVAFQIVTLPVEFNASSRALVMLRDARMIPDDEMPGARKVLSAAALTYVASAAASILQLLRLLLILGGRRDD